MAEFKDVIKQQKRICQTIEACNKCTMRSMEHNCRFMAMIYAEYDEAEVEAIQRIVMDWAEKHPEPRYPSWEEWWRREFPAADNAIYPCTCGIRERFACFGNGCETCRSQPIPADIAEKLGIKPIGGDADA